MAWTRRSWSYERSSVGCWGQAHLRGAYSALSASDILPFLPPPTVNEADGDEVTDAVEMLFYNAEAHLAPEAAQNLIALNRHIEVDHAGTPYTDTVQ